jgi:hypothetical protein
MDGFYLTKSSGDPPLDNKGPLSMTLFQASHAITFGGAISPILNSDIANHDSIFKGMAVFKAKHPEVSGPLLDGVGALSEEKH